MCRCLRLCVCVFVLVWTWMKVFKTMSALSRYLLELVLGFIFMLFDIDIYCGCCGFIIIGWIPIFVDFVAKDEPRN